jgi:pyruvate dehydrogenase E1 component alpha subunit
MEAVTYRQMGHHVNDPGHYMPREEVEHYKARDPVDIGRRYLVERGGASDEEVRAIEENVERELEQAIEFAVNSPEPSVEEFLAEVESY